MPASQWHIGHKEWNKLQHALHGNTKKRKRVTGSTAKKKKLQTRQKNTQQPAPANSKQAHRARKGAANVETKRPPETKQNETKQKTERNGTPKMTHRLCPRDINRCRDLPHAHAKSKNKAQERMDKKHASTIPPELQGTHVYPCDLDNCQNQFHYHPITGQHLQFPTTRATPPTAVGTLEEAFAYECVTVGTRDPRASQVDTILTCPIPLSGTTETLVQKPTPTLPDEILPDGAASSTNDPIVATAKDSPPTPDTGEEKEERPPKLTTAHLADLDIELPIPEDPLYNGLSLMTKETKILIFGGSNKTKFIWKVTGKILSMLGLAKKVSATATGVKCKNSTYIARNAHTYGRAEPKRSLDFLQKLGFNQTVECIVYPQLVEYLVKSHMAAPRSVVLKDGKLTPNKQLVDCWTTHVNTTLPDFKSHADPMTLVFSLLAAFDSTVETGAMAAIGTGNHGSIPLSTMDMPRNSQETDRELFNVPGTTVAAYDPSPGINTKFRYVGTGWSSPGVIDRSQVHETVKYKSNYFSVFGGGVYSNVQVHADNVEHLQSMIGRITLCRENETELDGNQHAWFEKKFPHYWQKYEHFPYDLAHVIPATREERMQLSADEARPDVYDLYQATLLELRTNGTLYQEHARYNEAKKKIEKAKYGKKSRMYVSLGAPASLLGASTAKRLKQLLEEPILHKHPGGDVIPIYFIARPSKATLEKWADHVMHNKPSAWVHSDDGSYISPSGSVYDIDISSCDASMLEPAFAALGLLLGKELKHLFEKLMAQIFVPLRVVGKGITLDCVMEVLRPYLPSGHIFTTAINTFILQLIMAELITLGVDSVQGIIDTGFAMGFKLTVSKAKKPQHATLLKHFAAEDINRASCAIPVLGIPLRTVGVKIGDLPGVGDPQGRGSLFNYGVWKSYKNSFSSPSIDAITLRMKPSVFTSRSKNAGIMKKYMAKRYEYKLELGDVLIAKITDHQFVLRYITETVSASMVNDLLARLKHARIGTRFRSDASDWILEMDYGIKKGADQYSRAHNPG